MNVIPCIDDDEMFYCGLAPEIYFISKSYDAGEGVKISSPGLTSPNRSDNSSTTKQTLNLEFSTPSGFSKYDNFLSTEEVEFIKSTRTAQ